LASGDDEKGSTGNPGGRLHQERLHDLLSRIESQAEEAINRIKGTGDGEVNLAEGGGAPPKELRPGDHWITIKPHGPGSDDYRHVIVRTMKDGAGMIVWAGQKGLTHLRLNKMGTKEQAEAQWAKRPELLTPEERVQQKEQRKQRADLLDQSRTTFGEHIVKNLGLEGTIEPEQALAAVETGAFTPKPKDKPEPKPKDEATEAIEGEREKQRLEKILGGDNDDLNEELGDSGTPIDKPTPPNEWPEDGKALAHDLHFVCRGILRLVPNAHKKGGITGNVQLRMFQGQSAELEALCEVAEALGYAESESLKPLTDLANAMQQEFDALAKIAREHARELMSKRTSMFGGGLDEDDEI
jgi:hypothetical protein